MSKSENRIQQECYIWFWNTFPEYRKLLFAVPNGGARSSHEGALLKKTGVVAGVSDMMLMVNGKTYCFELKTATGEQSQLQKDWEKRVKAQGFDYFVVRSLKEFSHYVNNIINECNGK